MPYLTACLFLSAAGALDPMGLRLMVISTIPAVVGGLSGLLWADLWMPRERPAILLRVQTSLAWPIAAVLIGGTFLLTVARGIEFQH